MFHVLFPPRCPICDDILEPEYVGRAFIHRRCEDKLFPVGPRVCMHCGRPVESEVEYCFDCGKKNLTRSFRQGKALFLYRGSIQQTMYRFKYANKREYGVFFGKRACDVYGEWVKSKGVCAIVPVPMYRPKQRRRGYNQAECFAKQLSRELGIPMATDLIQRCKDTAPQKELNDMERQKNLQNAFLCQEHARNFPKILVVDDIYTTGSTADAVTFKLLEAGVGEVYFLSICIGGGS